MALDEGDKSVIREFLKTTSAKRWLEHCNNSYKEQELGKVPLKIYNASLIEHSGWRKRGTFEVACVQEQIPPEYGVQSINPEPD